MVEDWRRYDAMLWQLPFGTMSAVGVILALAFHYIPSSEHVVRAILFIALAWFTLTMMHLSYKVRHFQIERSACIEAIECKCAKFTIPYDTKGTKKLVLRKEIKRFRELVLRKEVIPPRIHHVHRLNSHAFLPYIYRIIAIYMSKQHMSNSNMSKHYTSIHLPIHSYNTGTACGNLCRSCNNSLIHDYNMHWLH